MTDAGQHGRLFGRAIVTDGAPLVLRVLARHLCSEAGAGDPEAGAGSLMRQSTSGPCFQALMQASDPDAVAARVRRLEREIRAVRAETVLGLPLAARFSATALGQLGNLDRQVIVEVGAQVQARERSVVGDSAYRALVARALCALGGGPANVPRPGPVERARSWLGRWLDRRLAELDDLMRIAGWGLRILLVPIIAVPAVPAPDLPAAGASPPADEDAPTEAGLPLNPTAAPPSADPPCEGRLGPSVPSRSWPHLFLPHCSGP